MDIISGVCYNVMWGCTFTGVLAYEFVKSSRSKTKCESPDDTTTSTIPVTARLDVEEDVPLDLVGSCAIDFSKSAPQLSTPTPMSSPAVQPKRVLSKGSWSEAKTPRSETAANLRQRQMSLVGFPSLATSSEIMEATKKDSTIQPKQQVEQVEQVAGT